MSPDAAVRVRLDVESTSPPRKGDAPSTVRWRVEMAGGAAARIHFGYHVTYPVGRTIVGS